MKTASPQLPQPCGSSAAPALIARMTLVNEYRERLLRLQGAWDLLALLGEMSGIGTDIGQTRDSFQSLADTLLASLARQLMQQRLQGLRGKAQVAIDILVRNLFERTADVGFLATDAALRAFVESAGAGSADAAQRQSVQARLAAYVAKYSVYDDVILLAPDGRVLARLDDGVTLERSRHPLIAEASRSGVPYVESFGACDLLDGRRGLLYAAAIMAANGRPVGVLCLSFRIDDELRGIFGRLLAKDDGTVLALLDTQGEVIASSDRWQLPAGAPLPLQQPARGLLRFAGREYLREAAVSGGYQGYAGPGWQAQALIPADFAFSAEAGAGQSADTGHAALARSLDTRDIFDAELRGIPPQAQRIQRELARSVWNGKLAQHGGLGAPGQSQAFGATFLQEVSRTGMQIRGVFEQAIARLQSGGIGAVLDEAEFQAGLAIDIMDRNLYERANDCRWWALTPLLAQALAEPDAASSAEASRVLRHINGLYTVYTLLLLFDAQGRVVAVSDPARETLIGQPLDDTLVRATLALRDPQHYHVGPHAASPLYAAGPTYVYTAAVQQPGRGAPLGGVAIVFDGVPQFAAMLRDALPRGADGEPLAGACGLFVTRSGHVVASTDDRFAVGSAAPFAKSLLGLPRGAADRQVLTIDGIAYAAGICHSGGYREYRRDTAASEHDVAAVILLRLGAPLPKAQDVPATVFQPRRQGASPANAHKREIAAFTLGLQWFGLQASEVEEVLAPGPIIGLPQAPPQLPGLVRHRGQVVPVLDLGALLHPGAPAQADGPLLLCRSASGRSVAMRVDALGNVFEVDARQLVPWQARAGALPVQLLSGSAGEADEMLTLLSADALWQALGDGGRAAALAGALDVESAAGVPSPAALDAAPRGLLHDRQIA